MILSYWYIFLITIPVSLLVSWAFKRLQFVCSNYRKKQIPYAGGTVMLVCVIFGYTAGFFLGRITFFKLSCFSISMLLIYALGIFYDLYGMKNRKGLWEGFKELLNRKISIEIIEAVAVFGISSYIYFFLNEQYWLIKGLFTLIIMNLFNIFEHKPGRTIKAYYFFFICLILTPLRWTRDLYYISFAVLSALYYFDAYCLTAMGRSGSNLTGFIVGLMITEAISTRLATIILMLTGLTVIQIFIKKDSFITAIKQIQTLDYLDRLLTERRNAENVKSQ